MLARATLVVAALATMARADEPLGVQATLADDDTGIATEVSLGGGGDTTASSYTVGRIQLTTALARRAPPIERSGLGMCPVEEKGGCFWALSGPDPGGVEGIGAHAEAELFMPTSRATATGTVWARWGGWNIEATGTLQPVADMRAPIWRSGRGVFEGRMTFDMPALWALGTRETQFLAMPWHLALGRRVAFDGDLATNAGFDRDIAVSAARVLHRYLKLDILHIGLRDYGLEVVTRMSETGPVTYGNSATILDLEIANLTLNLPRGFTARGQAGVRMLMPVSPFTRRGTSETSTGPMENTPMFWGEVGHADDNGSVTVGAGNWSRLDATGHAGDAGRLAQVQVERHVGRVSVRSELALGRLTRIVVGDRAPPEIASVGTRHWMGRAVLGLAVAVRRDVAIEASAWAERSDRDDPRWGTPATGDVSSRLGADVSAAWRFARKR